jgi:nucleotide-binding universal stress UspA family protein
MDSGTPISAPTTIGVGYDGSPDSVAALRWAARLAVQCGSRLAVLHAVGLLEHAGLAVTGSPHRDDVMEIVLAAGLDEGSVEWMVADGDPCSALLRLADAPTPVDMLVVGSRGRGQHAGTLVGSTSLELVEHSAVPVVVVPVSWADHTARLAEGAH